MVVPTLSKYENKYEIATFKRDESGVLEVTLQTDGTDFVWGMVAHEEMPYLLEDIGRDPENQVIVLTGAGDTFIHYEDLGGVQIDPPIWAKVHFDAKRLLMAHLDIEVPMIAAINGPASVHAELGLLCDIVLASPNATFRDTPHFPSGLVPGDGVHVVWQALLGPNRGRYFLLTGQELDTQQSLDLGVINEVVPRDQLLPRAHELAQMILERPPMTVRYTRAALVQQLKQLMTDILGYGLMLEGMAGVHWWPKDFGNKKP